MLQMRAHDLQHSLDVCQPGRAAVFQILEQTFVRFPTDVAKNDSICGGPVHDRHSFTLTLSLVCRKPPLIKRSRFSDMAELPRRLGLSSAIAVLVGTTIGSGIFRSPAGVAEKIPDSALFVAAWIAGGLCVLSGALTYAELAGALPHTGGVYVYLREAFGSLAAFLFGWSELTII